MTWILFSIFAVVRLFYPYTKVWIWGDLARHLGCVKTFPYNKLYNRQYYDVHPPLFSYAIRIFSLVMPDHTAAIVVNYLSGLGLFYFIYKIIVLYLPASFAWVGLVYLLLNKNLYDMSIYTGLRYVFFAFLFTACIYFILAGSMFWAVLFGVLCFLTSDILPFPLIILFLLFGHWFGVLATLAGWVSLIIIPKWFAYIHNNPYLPYYPACVEGKIENIIENLKDLKDWKKWISPFYLDGSQELFKRVRFKNPHNKLFQVIEIREAGGFLNWVMLLVVIFGLQVADWRLLLFVLCICAPMINVGKFVLNSGFFARNAIGFVPIFAYFLSKGAAAIYQNSQVFLWCLAVLFIIYSIRKGYPIFTVGRIDQAQITAQYINSLPKDGIMVEGLISQYLAYKIDKRIICLSRVFWDDAKTEREILQSIEVFDINYIVLSEFYKTEPYPYPAVDYIKANPDKFTLLKEITEMYDTNVKSDIWINGDRFYVYEVKRDDLQAI